MTFVRKVPRSTIRVRMLKGAVSNDRASDIAIHSMLVSARRGAGSEEMDRL